MNVKKQVYVPLGQTSHFDSLKAHRIIVDGELTVTGNLDARRISGKGKVVCGSIEADTVNTGVLEAGSAVCNLIAVNRGKFGTCYASERILAREFFRAAKVQSPALYVSCSEIGESSCDKIIHLKPKKRSLLLFILAAFFTEWRVRKDFAAKDKTDKKQEEVKQAEQNAKDNREAEIVSLLNKMADERGYTLTKKERKAA